MGESVCGLGDVDGDGFADFAVGAPGGGFGGQVTVYSGATGAVVYVLNGMAPVEAFGRSIAPAEDFDGDGIRELLVGAPIASPGGLPVGTGRLFSGATGSLLLAFDGTDVLGQFTHSIACLGDVTGDGVPEILAGAPVANTSGLIDNGRVRVISGADGTTVLDLEGSASFEGFGSDVARIGDLNGDGFPDFAVGAPGANPSGLSPVGQVTLRSGADGTPLFTWTGTNPNEKLGFSVAGLGDVDGDGAGDVAAGRPGADPGAPFFAGAVDVFSAGAASVLLSIPGPVPFGTFGGSVGAAGDVDFDGVPDLIAGAYSAQSGSFSNSGFAGVYSAATGSLLASTWGSGQNQQLGSSVNGLGDVNGDGAPDFAAGAPIAGIPGLPGSGYGYVRVFSAAGIPPGSTLFGLGCPGTGGATPGMTTMGGSPSATAGNPAFRVVLTRAPGGTPAFLVVGLVPLFPGFDLGPFGSPGCPLFVAPGLLLPATTAGPAPGQGGATISLAVPPDPALVGASLLLQWYVVDPGPALAPGAVSSPLLLVLP
ncbi:MAG: integrin alpha [Planctomycetes bacterium]|nr:integrin alpha [Planctomycetota bacterium]